MCVSERRLSLLLLLLYGGCYLIISPQGSKAQELNCTCQLENGRCDEDTGECKCDPGWGGATCGECLRMPGCVHGSCHQPWQCTCEPGWTGRFCDKDVYVCEREEPCRNGATCVTEDSGDYTCLCPDGFHGRHCEFKMGPCYNTKSPCKNGGLCEDLSGFSAVLKCRCLAGFTGPRCETNVDDCRLQPCANGATCVDGVNRFSCLCPPGFSGRFCSANLDDCAGTPCLNGGRCVDRVSSFLCLCVNGFSGKTCQVPPGSGRSGGGGGGGQWGAPERVGQTGGGQRTNNTQDSGVARGTEAKGQLQGKAEGEGDKRLLKISVKEVMAQHGGTGWGGLSEAQLITLLVLGGVTLAMVALTGALVLRGHWQKHCAPHCRCRPPPPSSSSRSSASSSSPSSPSSSPSPSPLRFFRGCRATRGSSSSSSSSRERGQEVRPSSSPLSQSSPPAEQECKISFLEPPPDPPGLEKKKLNSEII
ncbi:protein delta homolog 2 [Engraulis encrasicolus]|uniref:protein delta homolog 2 n=1 Tax=Engraulis encrasicolus TaxID=184585 RepID=UPI002FD03116